MYISEQSSQNCLDFDGYDFEKLFINVRQKFLILTSAHIAKGHPSNYGIQYVSQQTMAPGLLDVTRINPWNLQRVSLVRNIRLNIIQEMFLEQ